MPLHVSCLLARKGKLESSLSFLSFRDLKTKNHFFLKDLLVQVKMRNKINNTLTTVGEVYTYGEGGGGGGGKNTD